MAVQPRRNSLTEQYGQAMNMKAMQQQMAAQEQTSTDAAARKNALKTAWGPEGLDYEAAQQALVSLGDVEGAVGLRGQALKEEEAKATQQSRQLKANMEKVNAIAQLLGGAKSQEEWDSGLRRVQSMGITPDDVPATWSPEVSQRILEQSLDAKSRLQMGLERDKMAATEQYRDQQLALGKERNAIARTRAERPPGNGMSVSFDENGNPIVQVGGAGPAAPGNMGLTKTNQNEMQKDVISGMGTLSRLDEIANSYKSDYLTAQGAAKGFVGRMADKVGMASDDQKSFIQGRRKFTQQVDQEFNAYRKEITGAAAAMAELKDLKKAMINTDLSPAEFEAAYMAYRDSVARMLRIRQGILREGVPVGSREFNKRLDDAWLSGGDDDIEARGDELAASGMSEAQVKAQLRTEGYRF
jgi:hypothetical protein